MKIKLWALSTEVMVYIVEKGEFSNGFTPKGSPEKRVTVLVKGRNRLRI